MKFRYLDGLRGLAALIVVIDHYAISFFQAATDGSVKTRHSAFDGVVERTPLHVLVSGNFAVCIFFVLSGFVLSAKFFHTGQSKVVIASAAKRYVRLALPVLGSVMLAYILLSLHAFYNVPASQLTGSQWLGAFWQNNPSFFGALYHATIGVFIKGSSNYNTVLWTMKTELIGSFLVFGFLLAFGKAHRRWIAYLALSLILIKTYYIAFILGVAICDDHYHGQRVIKPLTRPQFWLPLTLVSLILGSSPVGSLQGTIFQGTDNLLPLGLPLATTTHLIGAIGLVLASVSAPIMQRWLTIKPITYLGKISFALYLTHFLILGSLSSFLFVKIAPSVGYQTDFVIVAIISGVVIWRVADLFTRYIDGPAIRLSAKLYNRYVKRCVDTIYPSHSPTESASQGRVTAG